MDAQDYLRLLIAFICGCSITTLVAVTRNGNKLDEINNKMKQLENILNELKKK